MALGFDDQISFGKAILIHWRTHFPGQEIADMTDTEFETTVDKAETDLADWRTKFAVAAKAEGPGMTRRGISMGNASNTVTGRFPLWAEATLRPSGNCRRKTTTAPATPTPRAAEAAEPRRCRNRRLPCRGDFNARPIG